MGADPAKRNLIICSALISILGVAFLISNILTFMMDNNTIVVSTVCVILDLLLIFSGYGIYRGIDTVWSAVIVACVISLIFGILEILSSCGVYDPAPLPKPGLQVGIIDTVLSVVTLAIALAPPARKNCVKKFFTLE